MNNKVAIILAAGSGARFDSDQPKQFHTLNHRSILQYSYDLFVSAGFTQIIFVGIADRISSALTVSIPVNYVTGGETRQASVYNGLTFIEDNLPETDDVYIHDSARPLATVELVNRIVSSLDEQTGIVPVIASTDSLVDIDGNYLERSNVKLVQTPQAFPFKSLLAKHRTAREESIDFSDDGSLYKKYGGEVKLIEGEVNNLKITTLKDFKLAELIISPR